MNIAAPKERTTKPVNHPKKYERQFVQFCVGMIGAIVQQFRNETLLSLNKSTVAKFEDSKPFADSQVGNYASVFLDLARVANKKLVKRFSDDRLRDFVRKVLGLVKKYNGEMLYASIAAEIGIDPIAMMRQEGLSPDFNALIEETYMWALTLRDETLKDLTNNTLRAMTLGKSLEDILREYNILGDNNKGRAKFIARNQVASFNNLSSKIRYQNLGITRGRWKTNVDGRERDVYVGQQPPYMGRLLK